MMTGTLHAYMLQETKRSLQMLKFAINHPERFKSWWSAALAAWLKLFMNILIEITNGIIICG
jgi:hypothetical protein